MLPEINLLPQKERQSSFVYYTFIGLIILSILLIGYVAYAFFDTKKELARTTQSETLLSEQKVTLETEANKLEKPSVDSLEKAVARTEAQEYPTSIIINHLLVSLPEHSYLIEYYYKYGAIETKNYFESMNDISIYTETLLSSPFVTNVEVQEIDAFFVGPEDVSSEASNYDYLENIPRYEVEMTLQMNTGRILAVDEEEAESIVQEIAEFMDKGASAE